MGGFFCFEPLISENALVLLDYKKNKFKKRKINYKKSKTKFLTGSWCEPEWIYNELNELGGVI